MCSRGKGGHWGWFCVCRRAALGQSADNMGRGRVLGSVLH